jgi:hypothetical protein
VSRAIGRHGTLQRLKLHLDAMYDIIVDLTPEQRRNLRRQLNRIGRTNCSWRLYGARPLMSDMLEAASPNVRHRKPKQVQP